MFRPPPRDLGPKSWQLPSDVLNEEFVVDQLRAILDLFKNTDPIRSWEAIKSRIKVFIQEHTAYRRKQDSIELVSLRAHLRYINKCIFNGETTLD